MTEAERNELAEAVTLLVAADLRRQITTSRGVITGGGTDAAGVAAQHELSLAARRVGELLYPARSDRFVAKLLHARRAVLDELDPLGLRCAEDPARPTPRPYRQVVLSGRRPARDSTALHTQSG